MPKVKRKKSSEAIYHVTCRSITEVSLFTCDEEKQKYLSLVKRYCDELHASIYAYIMMDNHLHLFIDPKGGDISTYMHSLNSAYVKYYNKQHARVGHLFQERFVSKIVDNNIYGLTLMAYIHNNCSVIPGYDEREEYYPFSSYGIYLGLRKDTLGLLDTSYMLNQFSTDANRARVKHKLFVTSMKGSGVMNEIDKDILKACIENEYRSEKKYITRDKKPEEVLARVCRLMGEAGPMNLKAKYRRDKSSLRAFAAYVLRVLCGCTHGKICEIIGNMSLSGVVRLVREGFRLCNNEERYREAFCSLF